MKRDMERRLSAMECAGRARMIVVIAHEGADVPISKVGANDLLVRINKPMSCEPIIRVLAA